MAEGAGGVAPGKGLDMVSGTLGGIASSEMGAAADTSKSLQSAPLEANARAETHGDDITHPKPAAPQGSGGGGGSPAPSGSAGATAGSNPAAILGGGGGL